MIKKTIKEVNVDEKRAQLKKVKVDTVNWIVYYIDELSGEKWMEEYPYSEMQGGGPTQFSTISEFPWESKRQ